jgi:hypothetical protein
MNTRPDAKGHVTYRAGFARDGDGEITMPEQWLAYLKSQGTGQH